MTIPLDWVEVTGDQSPCKSAYGDESYGVMVYDVPFSYFIPGDSPTAIFANGAENIIGYILGYSQLSPPSNLLKNPPPRILHRFLPLEHPYLTGMYAVGITDAQPYGFGSRDAEGNLDDATQYTHDSFQSEYAVYHKMRLTILYKTPKFRVLSDAELQADPWNGKEYWRFTTWEFEAGEKILQGQKGSFYYAEGAGSGPDRKSVV